MAKLSDRMMRADIFADGRLLRVSPEARLLAIALESIAESTGMVRRDADEIRSAVGFFLADAVGTPPSRDDVLRWCDELTAAKWALDFTSAGMNLLYLQGFGTRQKGYNVAIGADSTNNKAGAHMPMPACVTLEAFEETVKDTGEIRVRKYLPRHCEFDYTSCPCEWYPKGSPTQHLSSEEVMEGDLDPDPDLDSESSPENGTSADLPASGLLAEAVAKLCEHYPGIERQSLAQELLRLSLTCGDVAVATTVDRTVTRHPKAPLPYIKKVLSQGHEETFAEAGSLAGANERA